MFSIPDEIKDLRWWKIRARLLSTFNHTRSWLQIFQSIIKAVTINTAETHKLDYLKESNTIFFHLSGRAFNARLTEGTSHELEILFTSLPEDDVRLWRETFIEYMNEGEHSKKFVLTSISDIEKGDIFKLYEKNENLPLEGELCLEFLTPLAFTPLRKERTFLTKTQFIKLITERLKILFGKEFFYNGVEDSWRLLPFYWHYAEIRHESLSQPGRVKYLNGCAGKLYIKGRWKEFLPYLLLAEELHAGTKITYARGYFRLHPEPTGYFTSFPDRRELTTVIIDTANKTDTFSASDIDEELLSEEIYKDLKEKTYTPSPATAFSAEGGAIFERFNFKDTVIQQYLLGLLEKPLNRTLHPNVLGYRKGVSLNDCHELINKALNEGYEYIATLELKSYWKEIDHDILIGILKGLLPERDYPILELVEKYLRCGHTLSGRYHERKKGLSMGSPLSPLLSNIYLADIDEELNREALSFRYADRFLILSKTPWELEEALERAKKAIPRLNLQIKEESLRKAHFTEGFTFCGIKFDGQNIIESQSYKKPLYITEEDCFIGVNGETIEVRKGKEVINSLPLHRLSEVIITTRASFSTAMLERALKNDIPVTIQLGSGYNITTIKPDSKKHYELSYIHTACYSKLTEEEILEIARLIVNSKLRSYTGLFNKRYEKKENPVSQFLENNLLKIAHSETLSELRAYEALCARRVFRELNHFINNRAFHLKVRLRRPPDRINSLLNMGYYLLFSKINAILRATGLNPYLGFLHEPLNRYESLVADLQELFRARIDHFIIKMINLEVITEKDFEETGKGWRLNPAGVKKFIHHFEAELDRKYASDIHTLRETIYEQVIQIKKWVLEEDELFFFVVMP